MAANERVSGQVQKASEVRSNEQEPSKARAKASYRAPQLFEIGSAVELLQGGRGRYADANGSSFW